jgi:hypothetical protein
MWWHAPVDSGDAESVCELIERNLLVPGFFEVLSVPAVRIDNFYRVWRSSYFSTVDSLEPVFARSFHYGNFISS